MRAREMREVTRIRKTAREDSVEAVHSREVEHIVALAEQHAQCVACGVSIPR